MICHVAQTKYTHHKRPFSGTLTLVQRPNRQYLLFLQQSIHFFYFEDKETSTKSPMITRQMSLALLSSSNSIFTLVFLLTFVTATSANPALTGDM